MYWTHGYPGFTLSPVKDGSTPRGTRESYCESQAGPESTREIYCGGWLFSGITEVAVVAPDLSRQPSLKLIMH
jgi:hypothetical protein